MQVSAELDRKKTIRIAQKFDDVEDNFSNWEKTSIAEAKKELKAAILKSARAKFDYDGNEQLNEKPDQVSLASSYESTVRQLGTGRGQFKSGLQLDVFYDAPHAKALERGTGYYEIFPDEKPMLSFLVKTPAKYGGAANKKGTKVLGVVGDRVTMVEGASVIRKPTPGYSFVRDGITDYWRQKAGDVEKETMKNILQAGFKIR